MIIVSLNIGDECQSICNGNTMVATGNAKFWAGVGTENGDDDADSDDNDDDDVFISLPGVNMGLDPTKRLPVNRTCTPPKKSLEYLVTLDGHIADSEIET